MQQLSSILHEGVDRVVIEGVAPEIDGGRFPVKRIRGEPLAVEADIFVDGHDLLSAVLLYRKEGDAQWNETPMQPLVNDRWRGTFEIHELKDYRYTVQAWVDRFKSWRRDLGRKAEVGAHTEREKRPASAPYSDAPREEPGQNLNLGQRFSLPIGSDQCPATRIESVARARKSSVTPPRPQRPPSG